MRKKKPAPPVPPVPLDRKAAPTTEEMLSLGLRLHQQGRLTDAERVYAAILGVVPDHPDVLHLRGVIAHQQGRGAEAVELIGRAIARRPLAAPFHYHLGEALRARGRGEAAAKSFRRAIELDGADPLPFNGLGLALASLGRIEGATEALERAIVLDPGYADPHNNLGNLLKAQGRLVDALACYARAVALRPDQARWLANLGGCLAASGDAAAAQETLERALDLDPACPGARVNLGLLHLQADRLDEAEALLRGSLQQEPENAAAWINLGNLSLRRGQPDAARDCFARVLARSPDNVEARLNLGHLLMGRQRPEEALSHFQEARKRRPQDPLVVNNTGGALRELGRLAEAAEAFEMALRLNPAQEGAMNNLGLVRRDQGRLGEAVDWFRRALAADPNQPETHANLIFSLDLLPGQTTPDLQAERRRWARIHAEPLKADQGPFANDPDPEKRLKIGYLSADFRRHSAAFVFASLFRFHDPDRFALYSYYGDLREDDLTGLFKAASTGWRSVQGLDDAMVAERIRADGIDILVDLSGHTRGRRLLTLARKPAPVQVSGWGYPAGTGMEAVDYLFADPILIPPAWRRLFAETVIDLPCALHLSPVEAYPDVGAGSASRQEGFTFGAFTRMVKCGPEVLALWAEILQRTPGSRLLLKAREMEDPAQAAALRNAFRDRGVVGGRIVTLGASSRQEQLRAHAAVDLMLDSFPEGGGVAALEALRMGVPVLTLAGETLNSRSGASCLEVLGLREWVVSTPEDYVALAERAALQGPRPSSSRRALAGAFDASVLGDGRAYTEAVEHVYRRIWRCWSANRGG